ncbi:MAG: YdcF family protein [Clostridia bacterium]|nr:YdcF family protein [Clostridia bacterium]
MKRFCTILLMCAAGAGFLLFFLPVPVYGVFNIGNITGMLLFGGLLVCVLFRKSVKKLLRSVWLKTAGKILICCLAAALFVSAVFGAVIGVRVVRAAKNAPSEGAELTVVVLGCRVYESGPSLMLGSRINTAYEYLSAHPDAVCILSGGQGDDEPESEAQAMFDALTDRGIDPARLIKEEKSRSTYENLTFSMEIIRDQGLPEGIALVTNEYHQYRAGLLAQDAGCTECRAVSAPSQRILVATYFVREIYGVAYAMLGGRTTYRVL